MLITIDEVMITLAIKSCLWDLAQTLKNPPAMRETWVRSLGWEDFPGGRHGNPLQY